MKKGGIMYVLIALTILVILVLLFWPSKKDVKDHFKEKTTSIFVEPPKGLNEVIEESIKQEETKTLAKPKEQVKVATQDAILYIERKWNIYDVERYLNFKGIPYVANQKDEGYLGGGRYEIKEGTPVKEVIDRMRQKFLKINGDVGYATIILASLIEKEMWDVDEAERLSGVFHNRMVKGMKLQSDPTTVYAHYREYMKRKPKRVL